MEKNTVAIIASKDTGEEAPIPVQSPAPASTVAAGEEAPAGLGQIPLDWYPYEKEESIWPENPYDTSIIDPWLEVDNSDDEFKHTKTRQVPRRMKSNQYDDYFADDVCMCPFCNKRLIATNCEDLRSCNPKVGQNMNVHAFIAKHKALGFHLLNLQKVAFEEVRMPPIKPKAPKIKGLGNKKWRKRQREEAEARRAEARRCY